MNAFIGRLICFFLECMSDGARGEEISELAGDGMGWMSGGMRETVL